jgi:hypothetical protein
MWYWDYEAPFAWKTNVLVLGNHIIRFHAYGENLVKDELDTLGFIPYTP